MCMILPLVQVGEVPVLVRGTSINRGSVPLKSEVEGYSPRQRKNKIELTHIDSRELTMTKCRSPTFIANPYLTLTHPKT